MLPAAGCATVHPTAHELGTTACVPQLFVPCTQIKDLSSQATAGMRQLYEKHLLAYERHCRAQDARKAAAPVLPLNGEVGDHMAAQILEAMLKAEPEDVAAPPADGELEGPPVKRRKVAVSVSFGS